MALKTQQRLGTLLTTLLRRGEVTQSDLQEYSPRTVYEDFETIASLQIERVRGGIRLAKGLWSEQIRRMSAAKHDIAERAASFFHAGVSVSVGCGSTTYRTCERMQNRRVSIEIITNNLALTRLAPGSESSMAPRISFVGGHYIASLMGTVGPAAEAGFAKGVRWGVVGASGVDVDGRLYITHESEVPVVRAMLEYVREKILVVVSADKLGRADLWEFASLSELLKTSHNGTRKDREVVMITNDPAEWEREIADLPGAAKSNHATRDAQSTLEGLRELAVEEANLHLEVVKRQPA